MALGPFCAFWSLGWVKFLFVFCIAQVMLSYNFKIVNKKKIARKVTCGLWWWWFSFFIFIFFKASFYGTEVVFFHLLEFVSYFKVAKQARLQDSVNSSCSEKTENCEVWHGEGNSGSSSVSGFVNSATLYYVGNVSARRLL